MKNKTRVLDLSNLTKEQTIQLNTIAKNHSNEYTLMIDRISLRYSDSDYWWSTALSSRNHYLGNSFFYVCLLLLVHNIDLSEYDRILVPDKGLCRAIKDNIDTKVSIRVKKENSGLVRRIVHRLKATYIYRIIVTYVWIARRFFCIERTDPKTMECFRQMDQNSILMSEPRLLSEFAGERFISHNTGEMEYYSNSTLFYLDNVAHLDAKGVKSILEKIRLLPNHVLVEQLIDYSDVKRAMRFSKFCRKADLGKCIMNGLDVSSILQNGLIEEAESFHSIYGLLTGMAFIKLVNEYKCKPGAVLEWYEGQAKSNGFIHMIREKYPDVLTIAYTYGQIGTASFHMIPSSGQTENKAVPEVYAVHGSYWKKYYARSYIRSIIAPSYRDSGVFTIEKSCSIENGSVLLILSLLIEESMSILKALSEAIAYIGARHIYIKNHPGRANYRLRDYHMSEKDFVGCKITYVEGNVIDVAKNKEIVLATATTALLPIMLTGAKVIYYCLKGRITDCFVPHGLIDYLNIAYDTQDIVAAIAAGRPPLDEKNIHRVKRECYTRADKKNTDLFFSNIYRLQLSRA